MTEVSTAANLEKTRTEKMKERKEARKFLDNLKEEDYTLENSVKILRALGKISSRKMTDYNHVYDNIQLILNDTEKMLESLEKVIKQREDESKKKQG